MRTFLKPFLLVMLALLLATSLTQIDTRSLRGNFPVCTQNATQQCPLLAFSSSKSNYWQPTTVRQATFAVSGLYARGALARPLATFFGVVVPLLLLEIAFLMTISRLAGRVPVLVAAALTIAAGAVFVAVSLEQYAQWRVFYGRVDLFSLWLNNPFMPRDAVIWLTSGVCAGSGLGLLALALKSWRRRALLK